MPETGGAPVLEVAGLRKEFGALVAVDDVSFVLPPGRSIAIVGESGSGKTTIARMIVGLERPTRGTITACGHDRSRPVRSARDRRRRGREVQIVFQDPYTSLDPRQTAEATIDEVLRLHHGWPAGRRRPASPSSPNSSAWTRGRPGPCPARCRAVSGSGSRSPGRWRPSPPS